MSQDLHSWEGDQEKGRDEDSLVCHWPTTLDSARGECTMRVRCRITKSSSEASDSGRVEHWRQRYSSGDTYFAMLKTLEDELTEAQRQGRARIWGADPI